MKVLAHIETPFVTKFGVPRQSGLVPARGRIIFAPNYRVPEMVRGLAGVDGQRGFSHLWLIWLFSEHVDREWTPTVRPPRLGGNTRMGVFATRAPFRPNPIALSAVQLERVEIHSQFGPILHVVGVDMMNGTPLLDVKPYVPETDCIPLATGGFTESSPRELLQVSIPQELLECVPEAHRATLLAMLEQDPRPPYQDDPTRMYGIRFLHLDVKFVVHDDMLIVRGLA